MNSISNLPALVLQKIVDQSGNRDQGALRGADSSIRADTVPFLHTPPAPILAPLAPPIFDVEMPELSL
jgi:hypothetical protein